MGSGIMPGTLIYGDNLDVLRREPPEKYDLIYLDPPFNSKRNYNLVHGASAQEQVFKDTWEWDSVADKAYRAVTEPGSVAPDRLSDILKALHDFLKDDRDTMAYLANMAVRLVELYRVLKSTGALYLHCDPTASHQLRLILDAIFGSANFRNEIVWKRVTTVKGNFGQGTKQFDPATDSLLFYTKSSNYCFHPQFKPYSNEYKSSAYRYTEPESGRRYRLVSMIGPGGAAKGNPIYEVLGVTRYWRYSKTRMQELISAGLVVQTKPGTVPARKYYLDEGRGVPVQSLWEDIPNLQAANLERTGYPTQKPLALLRRILETSSNKGDLVLDPFCGCGTTVEAAEELERRWVGIDIAVKAIDIIKDRLDKVFPELVIRSRSSRVNLP